MALFVRLTIFLTIGLAALFVIALLLKLVIVGAILAALALGGLFLVNFCRSFARRRLTSSGPLVR